MFCMYCSSSNESQQLKDWIIQAKILCVMHEIHMFDRNVWFANCLYCIKRWIIGQYASGYMDCKLFHCSISFYSTAISIKSTVAWLYCIHMPYVMAISTVGVDYLCYYTESEVKPRTSVNNKGILQLATVIYVTALFPTLKIWVELVYCVGFNTNISVDFNISYCTVTREITKLFVKSFDVWLHWLHLID